MQAFSLKMKKRAVRGFLSAFRFATLFCVGIILLYPIFNILSIAFRPLQQMTDPLVVWIPKSFTLDNVKNAMEALSFSQSLANTLAVTAGCSILPLLSCGLAGYGFARFDFRGSKLLFGLVLLTIVVMPQIYVIPRFLQYYAFDFFGLGSVARLFTGKTASVNLIGSYWTMLLPAAFGVGIRNGLFVYIFRQTFLNMPRELEESAHIDGCGLFAAYFRVIVPVAKVTFVMVLIFSVVWNWNDYLNAGMYMASKPTLSTKLFSLQSTLYLMTQGRMDLNATESNPYVINASMQAGCLMVIAPIMGMYLFLQRQFVESIERAGIVG